MQNKNYKVTSKEQREDGEISMIHHKIHELIRFLRLIKYFGVVYIRISDCNIILQLNIFMGPYT